MKLEEFARVTGLATKTELQKAALLAFFFHKTEGKVEFTREDIAGWFDRLHYGVPNLSRLVRRMCEARAFVRGASSNSFKLHAIKLDEFQQEHPGFRSESEDVISDDTILPKPARLRIYSRFY